MRSITIALCSILGALTGFAGNAPFVRAAENGTVVRGADELFWVPTLEQAIEMGKTTGRPIFLMGYSLVPNGSTYTKLGTDYCSGVF